MVYVRYRRRNVVFLSTIYLRNESNMYHYMHRIADDIVAQAAILC